MMLVLGALLLAASLYVPRFATWVNMQGLLLSVSTVGIVSCSMLFCLASGNFDLSVGSIVAFAGVIAAIVTARTGSTAAGVSTALLLGTLIGLANGAIVAKARINPLITTLASMQIVRGLALIVSDGQSVGVGVESFFSLGNTAFAGIPTPVWLCGACFLVFGFVLDRTVFGRDTLAIGGNEEAARLAGIAVDRVKIAIFALQGTSAAFAGIVLASRMTSGQPNAAQGFELEVISACVLGGVSLTGGVGRMTYVIAGVLIMGVVQNAMNLLNVPTFYQYVARGSILLVAVLLDRLKQRTS